MKTPHRDPVSLSEHIYLTLFSLRICLVYSAVVIFVILFSHRVWSSSRCVDENCRLPGCVHNLSPEFIITLLTGVGVRVGVEVG